MKILQFLTVYISWLCFSLQSHVTHLCARMVGSALQWTSVTAAVQDTPEICVT